MRTCRILFLFAATLATMSLSAKGSTGPFRPDAEKLRLVDEAAARWKTVTRFLIEYEGKPFSSNSLAGPVRRVVAAGSPGEFHHFNAHFPGYPWQLDPYCQEYFIHQGK